MQEIDTCDADMILETTLEESRKRSESECMRKGCAREEGRCRLRREM